MYIVWEADLNWVTSFLSSGGSACMKFVHGESFKTLLGWVRFLEKGCLSFSPDILIPWLVLRDFKF